MTQETKCLNCGTVLTNGDGERIASANFDSDLPLPGWPQSIDMTIWARCDTCMAAAKGDFDFEPAEITYWVRRIKAHEKSLATIEENTLNNKQWLARLEKLKANNRPELEQHCLFVERWAVQMLATSTKPYDDPRAMAARDGMRKALKGLL